MKTLPLIHVFTFVLFLLTDGQCRSPGSDNKWGLWQDGPHLRGVNIHQRRSYPDMDDELALVGPVIPPYAQKDFDKLAEMGANYVNISHPGLFTEEPPYQVDLDIQANLDQLLAQINNANMFAVITFRTGPGRNEFVFMSEEDRTGESRDLNTVWTDQAAQDAWVEMWRYTAERYRGNPIVVGYDLMAEPNANAMMEMWDPEEFYQEYAGTLYDWNQFYPRITTAIREIDPDTPILIGAMGNSTANWLPYLEPTDDPYTVYLVHQYQPFRYTHQNPPFDFIYPGIFDGDYDGIDEFVNKNWLDNFLSPIDTFKEQHNRPVAINEYGLKRWQLGAAQFMADEMALLEARNLNHAWWQWPSSDERFIEHTQSFNPLLGPDPDNRSNVTTSALLEVIKQNWSLNTLRPRGNKAMLILPIIGRH